MSTKEMAFEEELAKRTFNTCHFTGDQRREWLIWAARGRTCPKCQRGPHRACIHMGDVRMGRQYPREVRWPHDERVDWKRLVEGLKQRGYIS